MDSNAAQTVSISPPDEPTMTAIEAKLAAGTRAFALKNYGDAADCFSRALEVLCTHYATDCHPAIVDAQILYGKALVKNGIRLNAVLGQPEAETHASEAKEEMPSGTGRSGPSGSLPTAPRKSGVKRTRIHFSGDMSSDDDETDEEEGDDDENAQPTCTADEELEAAFQILDLARLSLEAQVAGEEGEARWKLHNKLIQVFELLSEVHQELEAFTPALEAHLKSLEIKKTLPIEACSARSIAETHLYVALAYEMATEEPDAMAKAMKHVEQAIGLVQTHIRGLEAKLVVDLPKVSSNVAEPPSSAPQVKEEVEECHAILEDLEAKLEELKIVPQAASPDAKELAYKAYLTNVVLPLANAAERPVVNDLSNLVKKKKQAQASGPGAHPAPIAEASDGRSESSKRILEPEECDSGKSKWSRLDADAGLSS